MPVPPEAVTAALILSPEAALIFAVPANPMLSNANEFVSLTVRSSAERTVSVPKLFPAWLRMMSPVPAVIDVRAGTVMVFVWVTPSATSVRSLPAVRVIAAAVPRATESVPPCPSMVSAAAKAVPRLATVNVSGSVLSPLIVRVPVMLPRITPSKNGLKVISVFAPFAVRVVVISPLTESSVSTSIVRSAIVEPE